MLLSHVSTGAQLQPDRRAFDGSNWTWRAGGHVYTPACYTMNTAPTILTLALFVTLTHSYQWARLLSDRRAFAAVIDDMDNDRPGKHLTVLHDENAFYNLVTRIVCYLYMFLPVGTVTARSTRFHSSN